MPQPVAGGRGRGQAPLGGPLNFGRGEWLFCHNPTATCIQYILVRGQSGVPFGLYHTSDYKIAVIGFVNHEYDYRPTSDDTKSTCQLTIKTTIFEKHKK